MGAGWNGASKTVRSLPKVLATPQLCQASHHDSEVVQPARPAGMVVWSRVDGAPGWVMAAISPVRSYRRPTRGPVRAGHFPLSAGLRKSLFFRSPLYHRPHSRRKTVDYTLFGPYI